MIKFLSNVLFPCPACGLFLRTTYLRIFTLITGLAAILLLPQLLYAQQALEEVIVTAERREQSLQDVPISATVFTDNDLRTKGIDNLNEIQQVAPGIAINTFNRSSFVNIRGVGIAQSAPTSNPGVAYYLDGVLIPHEQFIGQTFYDTHSIEVLRGPQGTLTGQNSTGGAIYVTTPAPDHEQISGYVDQTFANYDWYRTTGAVNLPLGDKTAVRVAGIYDTRDSFTDNIGPSGDNPGNYQLFSARGNLEFLPTDTLKINIRGEYFDLKTDYNAVKNRKDLVTSDPFTIEEDGNSYLNQRGYRVSGEARIDLRSDIQLRLLTSWQDGYTHDSADGDRTATALAIPAGLPASGSNRAKYPGRVSIASTDFQTWVSEVNLLSTGDSPLQWVVGMFYMDESIPVFLYRDNHHSNVFVSSDSDIVTEAKNTSISGFGQINYKFADVWELIAGLRYSEDQQDYERTIIPGAPPVGGFPYTTTQDSSALTGRGGLNYYYSSNVMLYGTVSRGYKAGGVNLDRVQGNFGPEHNTVYEFGVKSTVLDDRLRVNGDFFYSDYSDVQFSSLIAIGGPPLPVTQNAASAEAYGVELELTYAYDKLAWNFGIGYLHSEFAKDVVLNNTVAGGNELVPKGRVMPFSPKWTINAGVQYDFMIGGMLLTPRLQYTQTERQWATPYHSFVTQVPSRHIVDFRATLKPNDKLSIEAFVTNFSDETYIATQLQDSSSADGGIIYGAPLQFGVRGRYTFD